MVAILGVAGCGGSSPSTPTPASSPSAPPAQPTPIPSGPLSRNGVFDAVVLMDAQAPQTSLPEIQRIFGRAAGIFLEKTRESFRMTDAVYGLARGSNVSNMARAYFTTVAGNPPDGLGC
jgi:hypothetical protein